MIPLSLPKEVGFINFTSGRTTFLEDSIIFLLGCSQIIKYVDRPQILEVGVGNGLVLLSLGLLNITPSAGFDIDPEQVVACLHNVRKLNIDTNNIFFFRGDIRSHTEIFNSIRYRLSPDTIIANTPYIPLSRKLVKHIEKRGINSLLVDGGSDGTRLISPIFAFAEKICAKIVVLNTSSLSNPKATLEIAYAYGYKPLEIFVLIKPLDVFGCSGIPEVANYLKMLSDHKKAFLCFLPTDVKKLSKSVSAIFMIITFLFGKTSRYRNFYTEKFIMDDLLLKFMQCGRSISQLMSDHSRIFIAQVSEGEIKKMREMKKDFRSIQKSCANRGAIEKKS
ncbi:MAG: hypothetical protein ACFFHV_22720 [Promethearchaeota archaeon]